MYEIGDQSVSKAWFDLLFFFFFGWCSPDDGLHSEWSLHNGSEGATELRVRQLFPSIPWIARG